MMNKVKEWFKTPIFWLGMFMIYTFIDATVLFYKVPITATLSTQQLARIGAVYQRGGYVMAVTATLLHHSLLHVVSNVMVMWYAGWKVQKIIGKWWTFGAVLGIGALTNVIPVYLSDEILLIGSSGGALGLVGILLGIIFMGWLLSSPKIVIKDSLTIIVLGIITLVATFIGKEVNITGHLIGIFIGMVFGILIAVRYNILKTREIKEQKVGK